jgi:hypothetical protein
MSTQESDMAEKMTLHDRVEFALRDAGFDLDEASRIATLAESNLAQAVDVGAIREVADMLNGYCEASDDCCYGTLSTSLVRDLTASITRAIGNAQAEGCIPVPRSLIERWANVDAFNAPVGAAMELRTIAGEMLLSADKRDFSAQTPPTQATPNAHE